MNKICFVFVLLKGCVIMTSPVSVANGGTGIVTATAAYAVLCGGTMSTGPVQSLASAGTAGQALISGGAGVLPSFGTLGFAGGGTGASSLSAGVIQSNASVLSSLGEGSASQVLFNSAGTVEWAFTGALQMVFTSTSALIDTSGTSISDSDSIPQNTDGTQILTLSITPISSSSFLWINFTTGGTSTASSASIVALFVDSTADALAAQYMSENGSGRAFSGSLDYIVASGSTSARTYKIRIGGGDFQVNASSSGQSFNGTASTTLTIIEFI